MTDVLYIKKDFSILSHRCFCYSCLFYNKLCNKLDEFDLILLSIFSFQTKALIKIRDGEIMSRFLVKKRFLLLKIIVVFFIFRVKISLLNKKSGLMRARKEEV